MAVTIGGSVGAGGKNNTADVRAIQTLLNKWTTPPIAVTGVCTGTETDPTVAAIKAFQSRFSNSPDGRVDAGGGTLRRLNQEPLVQLATGLGYYSYSDGARQWGTRATIDALGELGRQFFVNNPTTLMGIGDISFEFGGPMSPHSSHQAGRHIDLRPLRLDRAQVRVDYTDTTNYDQANTKLLIELFLSHRNVSAILFNDPVISALDGVSWYRGHDNHFHVTMIA
jgi:Penicillin-insensitive murein endopeptidase/Putative peptidoglycan binding domain